MGRNAGDITISGTNRVDTGILNSNSTDGDAGNITVTSSSGVVDTSLGSISASGQDNGTGNGNSGDVTITASDTVTLGSIDNDNFSTGGDGGSITISGGNGIFASGIDLDTSSSGGNGGNVDLQSIAGNIEIGNINTNADVTGINFASDAGTITISAPDGSLTAGNITATDALRGSTASIDLTSTGDLTVGNVKLGADTDNSSTGTLTFNTNNILTVGTLDTNGANITIGGVQAPSAVNFTGNITTEAGDVVVTSQNTIDTASTVTITTTGGLVDFNASGNITIADLINTSSTTESGGDVSLTSNVGNITTGDINANANVSGTNFAAEGGNITLSAVGGSITTGNLSAIDALRGSSNNITIDAGTDINLGNITTGSLNGNINTDSSSIDINTSDSLTLGTIDVNFADLNIGGDQAPSSVNFTGNIDTATGDLVINSQNTIDIPGIITTNGGLVDFNASGNITTVGINTNSTTDSGGDVSLTSNAGNIITGDINANANVSGTNFAAEGGNITLSAVGGSINTGNLSAIDALNGSSNSITIDASTDINLGDITFGASDNNSTGALTIDSNGVVTVGTINSQGANILIGTNTPTNLNTGNIVSDGGNVTLNANNTITVSGFIDAQNAGNGGDVTVSSQLDLVRVSGTFIDNDGNNSSIASSGTANIVITHNGNGINPNVPFIVGDSTVNGTAGDINS